MSAPDLGDRFYDAWVALSRRLGIDPIALARVSFAETGMYRRHPRNAAAGVWPFIESTLRRLGWSGSAVDFTALAPEDQLPYLERYLQPYAGRLRDDAAIYVVMFLPARLSAALAGGDGTVLTTRGDPSRFYEWNTILDRDGDGVITVGDLRRHMDIMVRGERWNTIAGEVQTRASGVPGVLAAPGTALRRILPVALVAGAGMLVWYFYATDEGARTRQRTERRIDDLFGSRA